MKREHLRPAPAPLLLTLAAMAWVSPPVSAQALDLTNHEFLVATMVVVSYDHYASRCNPLTPSAAERDELERWLATNAVDGVRARLAELERDPEQAEALRQIRERAQAEFSRLEIEPCTAALLVTRTEEADLRASAPAVLAALSAQGQAGQTPSTPPTSAQAGAPPTPTHVDMSAIAEQIDSFGFDYTTGFGVGGFMTIEVYPVVLFRSGDALRDIGQLGAMTSIEAARQASPGDWTQWRRSGGEVELQTSNGGWQALPFTATYGTLPPGFVLDGLYRSLSGGGNVAMGGASVVAAWSDYRFFPDGVVIRDQGAGGFGEFMDVSVAVSSLPPSQRGRYAVDGLVIHLRYDDGSEERRILVTDPDDDEGVIWLDGVAYSWRSTR